MKNKLNSQWRKSFILFNMKYQEKYEYIAFNISFLFLFSPPMQKMRTMVDPLPRSKRSRSSRTIWTNWPKYISSWSGTMLISGEQIFDIAVVFLFQTWWNLTILNILAIFLLLHAIHLMKNFKLKFLLNHELLFSLGANFRSWRRGWEPQWRE